MSRSRRTEVPMPDQGAELHAVTNLCPGIRARYIAAIAGSITWLLTPGAATALAQSREYMLSAEFETEIGYAEALSRLDGYYQKAIEMGAEATLPRVAQNTHFEVW